MKLANLIISEVKPSSRTKKLAMMKAGEFLSRNTTKASVSVKKGTVWIGNQGYNVDQLLAKLEDIANIKPFKSRSSKEEFAKMKKLAKEAEKLTHEIMVSDQAFKNYQRSLGLLA